MGISSGIGSTVGALPAGSVIPFAGSTAPANWLLCYGQAVSRTDYGALFAVVGTTYGSGDGSTTFNVPDLRGRVIAGVDNMGGSAASRLTSTTITGGGDAVGEVGGAQTHTLSTSEMPSHTHIQDSHNHTQNAHSHGITDPGHLHSTQNSFGNGGTTNSGPYYYNLGSALAGPNTGSAATGISINNATPTNVATTATNQPTGGGGAHNNVQPTMVMNYIIKATAL